MTDAGCLRADAKALLLRINTFLKERKAKSPAYDPSMANDPRYSEKQEAYEQETSRLYLQLFWPSMRRIFQRAVDAFVTPEGTTTWARELWVIGGGKQC